MSNLELHKRRLRLHDRLWLGAGCFAAAAFALMSVLLPGQGWPSFGVFILGIVGVNWFLSRRRIATSDQSAKLATNCRRQNAPQCDSHRKDQRIDSARDSCALFGLMQLTDFHHPFWQRLLMAIGCWSVGAFGGVMAWWGFRQPLPRNSNEIYTVTPRLASC